MVAPGVGDGDIGGGDPRGVVVVAPVTEQDAENYALSTLDLENSRQSISGVDLNDEATSMMQFSKSYSAACTPPS